MHSLKALLRRRYLILLLQADLSQLSVIHGHESEVLRLYATAAPQLSVFGVDVNRDAIWWGNNRLRLQRTERVIVHL